MPAAETNLGGALQLLVDLQYIAGALSPLAAPTHDAVVAAARERILRHVLGTLGAGAGGAEGGRLEAWLQGVEVRACKPPAEPWGACACARGALWCAAAQLWAGGGISTQGMH